MKKLKTTLISSIFKGDLLLSEKKSSKQVVELSIYNFNSIVASLKQLIKILESNKKLPLFLVCQNKQYSILIKKFLTENYSLKETEHIFLITYKTAVTLKLTAIYFLIDCQDSGLLCTKIQQQSNSIIYLVEKSDLKKKHLGEYILNLNIVCIKQIIFILTIIKKAKNINESI